MNPWHVYLVVFAVLSTSVTLAEDFKTINGKVYKDATVSRVEADGIVLRTKRGIVKVYFAELPNEVVDRLRPPEEKERIAAERAAEAKRIEAQEAVQREHAEKEKSAEVDLKQAVDQFQAAEQRASKACDSAAAGTLSGQVFVSSRGGENFKLGAVQVGLFARDAMDTLLPAIKKNADNKIEQLRKAIADADAAQKQAELNKNAASDAVTQAIMAGRNYRAEGLARDSTIQAWVDAERRNTELNDELNFCHSGGFYFAFFKSPIRTAETDADGRFVIPVPKTGAFVVAAEAKRSVGGDTEQYYWLQPVSLEGQQQLTQNLSNNNLTSTTESSSLIHTED